MAIFDTLKLETKPNETMFSSEKFSDSLSLPISPLNDDAIISAKSKGHEHNISFTGNGVNLLGWQRQGKETLK